MENTVKIVKIELDTTQALEDIKQLEQAMKKTSRVKIAEKFKERTSKLMDSCPGDPANEREIRENVFFILNQMPKDL